MTKEDEQESDDHSGTELRNSIRRHEGQAKDLDGPQSTNAEHK